MKWFRKRKAKPYKVIAQGSKQPPNPPPPATPLSRPPTPPPPPFDPDYDLITYLEKKSDW